MGRQSARIYFNGQDHKEMVTWDGTQYVYHDKAYIWNGSEYELVWEKLYGLKLLYETALAIDPVSSENNKYLYFTEGGDGSIIYRIKVNDKEPEPEEHYTSDKYTIFSAPKSSRGVGIYRTPQQYGNSPFDYRMLNLETGGYGDSGTFDFVEETGVSFVDRYGAPTMIDETASQAIDLNHKYSSILGGALINVWYNFLYFIAITGISAQLLDNSELSGTWIQGRALWDAGRLKDDPSARGLLPRFLLLTWQHDFSVLEYENSNKYLPKFTSTPPFSIYSNDKRGTMRDGILPMVDSSGRLWIVEVGTDEINYTDTEIDVSNRNMWDVDPSHKYVLDFRFTTDWTGLAKIIDIKTGKTVVDISDELHDILISSVSFVGHKCLLIVGYINNFITSANLRYRLYKWR